MAPMADEAMVDDSGSEPPMLERQIAEIENQIFHLNRSNQELEAHLKEHGHDPELRAAIGENIVSIAKRRAILEDLQKHRPPPHGAVRLQDGTAMQVEESQHSDGLYL